MKNNKVVVAFLLVVMVALWAFPLSLRRQNSVGFDGFQATSFFFREPTCAASITR